MCGLLKVSKGEGARMNKAQEALAIFLFKEDFFLDKSKSPTGRGFALHTHQESPGAALSPYYLNFRTPEHPEKPGPLTVASKVLIGEHLSSLAYDRGIAFDCFAGIPRAGVDLAAGFSWARDGGNMLTLIKNESGKGDPFTLDQRSEYTSGLVALLIDDVVSDARTKVYAARAIETHGMHVADIMVIIDREQGGVATLEKTGYTCHALFSILELIDFYYVMHFINRSIYREIRDYVEAQQN